MHSFGLHSPDMVPSADANFQFQGQGQPVPSDLDLIPRQRLYIDPDIIGRSNVNCACFVNGYVMVDTYAQSRHDFNITLR